MASSETAGDFQEDKVECVICMDVPVVRGTIPCCDHVFCFDCIIKWSNQENTCPLCKKRFRQVDRVDPAAKTETTGGRKRKARGGAGGGASRSVKVPRRNQSHTPHQQPNFLSDTDIDVNMILHELMSNFSTELRGLPRILEHDVDFPEMESFGFTMLPLLMRHHRHMSTPPPLPPRPRTRRARVDGVGSTAANPVEIDDEFPTPPAAGAASEPSDDVEVLPLDPGDRGGGGGGGPFARRTSFWRSASPPPPSSPTEVWTASEQPVGQADSPLLVRPRRVPSASSSSSTAPDCEQPFRSSSSSTSTTTTSSSTTTTRRLSSSIASSSSSSTSNATSSSCEIVPPPSAAPTGPTLRRGRRARSCHGHSASL